MNQWTMTMLALLLPSISVLTGCAAESEESEESENSVGNEEELVAGPSFQSAPLTSSESGRISVTFEATPLAGGIDGVMGLSNNAPTAYASFATTVRFSQAGLIEARSGASYVSGATPIPYVANKKYFFRIAINIPAKTYVVYVRPDGVAAESAIGSSASPLAFRPEQASVSKLSHWGIVSGPGGTFSMGNVRLAPAGVRSTLDPREPFAGQPNWRWESFATSGYVSGLAEAGLYRGDGSMRFGKVADPEDSSKKAYLFSIKSTDPEDGYNSIRAETNGWNPTNGVPQATDVWVLWALRLPDLSAATAVDSQCVFQMHFAQDGTGDERNPPFAVYFDSKTNKLSIRRSSNPSYPVMNGTSDDSVRWSESNTPTNQWQYFIMHTKRSWNTADSPFATIWRAVGAGAPQVLASVSIPGPNAYHSSNDLREYIKEGMYHWKQPFNGVNSRTRFSKGVHVFNHLPGHNETTMLNFLRSI